MRPGYYVRFVLTCSLTTLMASVALFAYAPLFGDVMDNELLWQEALLAVLAGIGALWTFSHGTNLPFPLSKWAYLYDALVAAVTALAFAVLVEDVHPASRAFAIVFLIGTAAFAGVMHFLDGGNRPSYFGPTMSKKGGMPDA